MQISFVNCFAIPNRRLLDRKLIFDFVRPFDLIPKYTEKCEPRTRTSSVRGKLRPAAGGASEQTNCPQNSQCLDWSQLLNEVRTFFDFVKNFSEGDGLAHRHSPFGLVHYSALILRGNTKAAHSLAFGSLGVIHPLCRQSLTISLPAFCFYLLGTAKLERACIGIIEIPIQQNNFINFSKQKQPSELCSVK